jgi:hypothetical protein
MRGDRADPEPVQGRGADVVGVLGDRHERSRTGQHRARPEQQHAEHPVAHPAGRPRIRHRRQRVDQRQRNLLGAQPGHHRIEVGVRLVEGSNDRRR